MSNPQIAAYVAERDTVLEKDNLPAFVAFATEQGIRFSSELSAEIAMHKMRTAIKTLTPDLRSRSKKWLQAQGYTPLDDGDVVGLTRAHSGT